MAPLDVDPAALSGAGTSLAAVGDSLTAAMPTLTGASNANTGQNGVVTKIRLKGNHTLGG